MAGTHENTRPPERFLAGTVIAVAGAGGPAGRAAAVALAAAGASVAAADADAGRLADTVAAARAAGGGPVAGETVDLLDPAGTRAWAERTEKEHGRVDGLVHLVGGWRGSPSFPGTQPGDWETLEKLLVRTVQHTSLAFHDPLLRSGRGRFALVSASAAHRPSARGPAYAAAKAAAEAWTLSLADSFARDARAAAKEPGAEAAPRAAAAILVVKALVHDALRAERPGATFAGFTDTVELAETITGLWRRPAREVNGQRLWLTPET